MTEATGSRAVSACSTPMSMFVSVTSQYSLLHGEDRHPRRPSSPPLSLDFLRLMDFRQRAFDIGQLEPVHLLRILLESSALRTRLPSHRRHVLTICIPFRIEYSKANAAFSQSGQTAISAAPARQTTAGCGTPRRTCSYSALPRVPCSKRGTSVLNGAEGVLGRFSRVAEAPSLEMI